MRILQPAEQRTEVEQVSLSAPRALERCLDDVAAS
jgi:hypothetical protein